MVELFIEKKYAGQDLHLPDTSLLWRLVRSLLEFAVLYPLHERIPLCASEAQRQLVGIFAVADGHPCRCDGDNHARLRVVLRPGGLSEVLIIDWERRVFDCSTGLHERTPL